MTMISKMLMTRIAGTATVAGALGAVILGLGAGAGAAQAAPGPRIPPGPPGPHIVDGSGHGHRIPPGQIRRACPWQSPGHWIGGPHGIPCT